MPTQVLMPALSPTMEEGTLAKWHVREGDEVRTGDVIAEIETDKATMEVEAVDEGTLAKILVEEGTDNVAVNTPIGVIAAEGEDASAAPSQASNGAAAPAADAKAPEAAKPGAPNAFGLIGLDQANAPAGGKRPLSSMTPTIVLKDGRTFLVTGSPGGSRIITTVLGVLLYIFIIILAVGSGIASS